MYMYATLKVRRCQSSAGIRGVNIYVFRASVDIGDSNGQLTLETNGQLTLETKTDNGDIKKQLTLETIGQLALEKNVRRRQK